MCVGVQSNSGACEQAPSLSLSPCPPTTESSFHQPPSLIQQTTNTTQNRTERCGCGTCVCLSARPSYKRPASPPSPLTSKASCLLWGWTVASSSCMTQPATTRGPLRHLWCARVFEGGLCAVFGKCWMSASEQRWRCAAGSVRQQTVCGTLVRRVLTPVSEACFQHTRCTRLLKQQHVLCRCTSVDICAHTHACRFLVLA